MATDAKPSDLTPPPPHPNQSKSILERLIDSFLQESSIQWMLVVGAAIISASSLMLVTRQWTSLPVTLKFLTILGYTAVNYAAAEYCGRRMRLHTTAQVLRCLTIILIPIGFLSLAWLTGDAVSLSNSALTLLLLVPATGFMVFAADRIFSHWLHGRQHAFVAAYMMLCLAGAMPVINTTWLAVLFSTGFWLVMTIGVVKVNRHVFWLTEEQRLPRVFGFLPIIILASQCVVLLLTKTLDAVPFHWLGLGLVMMAATVLMTTKSIVDVFRQRTGDLVHPLPWSIMTPLLAGLMLTAAGVLFSFHGFSFTGSATRAVVPTATIAAGLMFTIARDTRHRSFVWVGLILVTVAYQSCPTLLGDLVGAMKAGAASAVDEDRLPIAFYGLTYLPLLIGFALASRWAGRRGLREFQIPLKRFVSVVSVALLALSLTNLKAAFIVSAIGSVAFLFDSIMFRDRRFMLASIGALILAVASAVPFAAAMDLADLGSRWSYVALGVLGLAMSSLPMLDRFLSSSCFEDRQPVAWFSIVGQAISVTISVLSMGAILTRGSMATLPQLDALDGVVLSVVLTSLCVFTLHWRNYLSGVWMWVIALTSVGLYAAKLVPSEPEFLGWLAGGTGVIALAAYCILRHLRIDASNQRFLAYSTREINFRCPTRLASVLLPLADLTLAVFATLASTYFLPSLLWATITLDVTVLPLGWAWVCAVIAVAAILFRSSLATATTLFFAPVVAGISLGLLVPHWFHYEMLPLVYAVSSAIPLALAVRNDRVNRPLVLRLSSAWLVVIAPLAIAYVSPLVLAGSIVATFTLLVVYRDFAKDLAKHRTGLAILASVQGIQSASMLAGFRGFIVELPTSPLLVPACVWMLAAAVIAVIAVQASESKLEAATSRHWGLVLRVFAVLFFLVCLASNQIVGYQRAIIIASLIASVLAEGHAALRRQVEGHVWAMGAVAGLMVAWFHWHQQISVPHGLLRLLCVVAAAGLLTFAHRCNKHSRFHIFVRTATIAGLTMPLVSAVWSLWETAHGPTELLIVFGAAATWFVHGRLHQARQYVVGAAVMLNVGLSTLFASWSLTDPQMYLIPIGLTVIGLVELLRTDIPESAHDPLRYLGGLAILVSPCFAILGGSWLHIASLMILSVLVILLAIGLRLRALIHVGAAFLCVDLVAMVIRSTIDQPGMLWVVGLAVGASVIAIGAVCEHYRESLLSRIRMLSDELATWH
ncbi:hypothetical protein [Allorhodopirellula solitaria]|uniref:Uncharacterized protein n=1 Tax=Allorhodopirellula solitaria TaxID=2527987 RepID=A0A5C5YGM3_9BACT|nr:hypothetical protein [Allorhodopirellula solitaria]TWT74308.1 hypothetical protein CA85_11950 [Allorhodopirellula solitaria]